jgi:hypothetical protein
MSASSATPEFEGSRSQFLKQLAETGETPAFVGRARAPEEAWSRLLEHCRQQRDEMLLWPARHWAKLKSRVGERWDLLTPFLREPHAESMLIELNRQLPSLPDDQGFVFAANRTLLRTFLESATRFNQDWRRWLNALDLTPINRLRQAYNDYYRIEKAAALGSEKFNHDFRPLPLLGGDSLLREHPPLFLPTLK